MNVIEIVKTTQCESVVHVCECVASVRKVFVICLNLCCDICGIVVTCCGIVGSAGELIAKRC